MIALSESELHEIVHRVVLRTMGKYDLDSTSRSGSSKQIFEPEDIQASQQQKLLNRRIAIGADHGGYTLKEDLKLFLQNQGYQVDDYGTYSTDSVDYPDFAYAVADKVGKNEAWRGIIIDGAGIGSCMVANKVPGVRAAMCYNLPTALNSREHNNANVLTLGAGMINPTLARQIVETWLNTVFSGGRHARRVDKIMEIERR
jgi:RpiB/LacA/LacB family sugar-phosphate isomerase